MSDCDLRDLCLTKERLTGIPGGKRHAKLSDGKSTYYDRQFCPKKRALEDMPDKLIFKKATCHILQEKRKEKKKRKKKTSKGMMKNRLENMSKSTGGINVS